MDRARVSILYEAGTSGRRAPVRRGVAGALVLVLLGWSGAATAQAQIAEAWSRASSVDVSGAPISARLEAMGSLAVSVEDHDNRVNAYAFSDNPAALLSDQDSSSIEQTSRYDRFMDDYYGLSHSVVQRRSGFRAALRTNHTWVLGLEAEYGGLNASRHDLFPSPDNGRFIRDFDIPFPADFDPSVGDHTIAATTVLPRVGITYGRIFLKKVTLAGRFRYRHENESRSVPNPYEINLTSTHTELAGGALVNGKIAGAQVTLSGNAAWAGNHVRGLSDGPFNDDHYDWNRPEVSFGGQLGIRYKGWLRGIIDGRHRSHDGEEIAEVNWAAQYFLNPLPVNPNNPSESVFKKKWSALLSGLRRNEAASRWMIDLPGTPAHIGLRYRYYRELQWIHTDPTVLTSARDLDVRRLGYQADAGVSLDLPEGRGLLGTEVHLAREGRTDHTGVLPEISSTLQTYHFGAEYRALSWLPLRGGFVLIRQDPDRKDGNPPVKGSRVTAGVGYFWRFINSQIDAAYAREHLRYTPGDPSRETVITNGASLVLRYLF
jgi:hypothetical protein